MAINVYTGLMGSGKTYECVSSVILPALSKGRNVVTNIENINSDLIAEFIFKNFQVKYEEQGKIIQVSNDDPLLPNFFPTQQDDNLSIVKPGDLVALDEAWRFYGTDKKIHENHKVFFREHRHFVEQKTKVSCDLVLMVQDISDLHRYVKVVTEYTFRCMKFKSLGLNNAYKIDIYSGYKLTKAYFVKSEKKTYQDKFFPLYSSYSGGAGKEVSVDGRINIFKSKSLILIFMLVLTMGFSASYYLYNFFTQDKIETEASNIEPTKQFQSNQTGVPATNISLNTKDELIGFKYEKDGTYAILKTKNSIEFIKIYKSHDSNFVNIDGNQYSLSYYSMDVPK